MSPATEGPGGPDRVVLEGRGIVRVFDERVVVDHADIVIEAGRIAAIIGPNGAGKTTLFNALSGEDTPDEGVVLLGGVDVTDETPDTRARMGLARTFQQSTVFPTLTVEENLRVAAENRRRGGMTRGLLGLADRGRTEATEIVEEVMAELGLRPLRRVAGAQLSTGTLRMVELARALCTRPRVLMLDEPASGLDDAETESLHLLLHRLADRGLALVLVEHDLDLVRDAADVVHVMAAGKVIAAGPPDEVMELPEVRAVTIGTPA